MGAYPPGLPHTQPRKVGACSQYPLRDGLGRAPTAFEVAVEDSYRLFNCCRCQELVAICPRCDRGNIYCSKTCSAASRRENNRESGRRYQATRRGRRKHAARMARYRHRQCERLEYEKVTQQGPPPAELVAKAVLTTEEQAAEDEVLVRCDVCGRFCLPLARREPSRQRRRVRLSGLPERWRRRCS